VKFGAKPVEMSPQEAEKVQHAAVSWFGALADAFRAEFQDRSKSIIAAPAVMSALGALGHDLVDLLPAQRQQRQLELIAELRHIDWAPGQHWADIAGKLTASGKFTVGGAKETAYAIYNEAYKQTRRRRAAVEDTLRKPLKRTMKAEGLHWLKLWRGWSKGRHTAMKAGRRPTAPRRWPRSRLKTRSARWFWRNVRQV